jgi:4-amino-4-deoxy-L-arabinose transferase-like glycosyltransferase
MERRHAFTAGLGAVVILAVVKLLLHLAPTGRFGYGFFVDELYYVACSRHLAWGFVDMPPLFPAITALIRTTLGESLFAIRLLPALAGAALVVMTGLMARDLGGRRFAPGIAALGVVTAPLWLALHSIHTMNALEQLLWTGAAWVFVRIVRDGWDRGWLWFGLLCGVGLLNKHSMLFFGVAMVAGLLLTPERRALRSRWLWIGGLLAFAIFLPNLVWEARHHFPHFEMLANIKADGRDVQLNPLQFMAQQALMFNPVALPLWVAGLAWYLFDREGRRYRALGIAYLAVMAQMFLLDGRVYYPAPAYPMLFAAGGVALERWLAGRRFVRPAYATVLALAGTVMAPLFTPLLPPETLVRYSEVIGMAPPRLENHRLGPLPQLMADRFGWPEMAQTVARVYNALPPADRARAAIFGQNYGQAGAIDRYGPALGLPPAISGHVSYFYWGPRSYTGDVMIVLDDDKETLQKLFRSVEYGGRVEHPYSMPYQHFDVWVCRGMRRPLAEIWPELKEWN